jgi:type II secretory pathway component PulJ
MLIEVLVALAIVAFGVMACYRSISKCVLLSKRVERSSADIRTLRPVFFDMENGQRTDLGPLALDRLDPDVRQWKKMTVSR